MRTVAGLIGSTLAHNTGCGPYTHPPAASPFNPSCMPWSSIQSTVKNLFPLLASTQVMAPLISMLVEAAGAVEVAADPQDVSSSTAEDKRDCAAAAAPPACPRAINGAANWEWCTVAVYTCGGACGQGGDANAAAVAADDVAASLGEMVPHHPPLPLLSDNSVISSSDSRRYSPGGGVLEPAGGAAGWVEEMVCMVGEGACEQPLQQRQ